MSRRRIVIALVLAILACLTSAYILVALIARALNSDLSSPDTWFFLLTSVAAISSALVLIPTTWFPMWSRLAVLGLLVAALILCWLGLVAGGESMDLGDRGEPQTVFSSNWATLSVSGAIAGVAAIALLVGAWRHARKTRTIRIWATGSLVAFVALAVVPATSPFMGLLAFTGVYLSPALLIVFCGPPASLILSIVLLRRSSRESSQEPQELVA